MGSSFLDLIGGESRLFPHLFPCPLFYSSLPPSLPVHKTFSIGQPTMNTSQQSNLTQLAPAGSSSNGSSSKRPHPSRQTQGYPRKRSMKACKTCRLRKTKCNNERPVCGFCQTLGGVCDYEDEADVST